MKNFVVSVSYLFLLIALTTSALSQNHEYDPPWNTPPQSPVMFTIPGVDNVPDLYGDINDPQLVIFFAGNQFMCVDELLSAFKEMFPQYKRVFVETLPPGILAKQIDSGSMTIGNMRITLQPDIYTAGKGRIEEMSDYFSETVTYASNQLAIMVAQGNPKNIKGLKDLARNDVRVSMPNPAWEGISNQIIAAYLKAGGEELKQTIMQDKVEDSTTFLTQIHHRQTPMRILYGHSDAGPVWYSEAYYQQMIGHPIDIITIPNDENIMATYAAGIMKNAPHTQAAKDFMKFLRSATAEAVYKKFGFGIDIK